MRINNIPALNTHRMLNQNINNIQKSMEKLSSGKRINRSADDAIKVISSQHSGFGEFQNRLEHIISNLDNTSENLQAAGRLI